MAQLWMLRPLKGLSFEYEAVNAEVFSEKFTPIKQVLQKNLFDSDLREFNIAEMARIISPLEEFGTLLSEEGQLDLAEALDFISDVVGETVVESVGYYTGFSFVLSLTELVIEELDSRLMGNTSKNFEPFLTIFKKMYQGEGAKQVETSEDVLPNIIQESPPIDIFEDGSLSDFFNEVDEGLDSVEENLMSLEEEPSQMDLVNQLFGSCIPLKELRAF